MIIAIKKKNKHSFLAILLGLLCFFPITQVFSENVTPPKVSVTSVSPNKDTLFQKGLAFLLGYGEDADDLQAMHYFTLAAQAGHERAQVVLGALLAFESDAQDLALAKKYYTTASQAGNAQATLELAKMAEGVLNEERDIKKATRLEALAKQQSQNNMLKQIASAFSQSKNPLVINVTENPATILKKIRTQAEQDDVVAQWALAELIRLGFANQRINLDESSDWMKKSAEGGFARAQTAYAGMFFSGEGVEKDKPSGLFWLNKALAKKEPRALMMMAMEDKACGNRNAAAQKLYEALALGDDEIKQMIGLLYAWGNGVILNESEKMTEVRRFAQRGECEAMVMQGLMYAQGWECEQNESKALQVYEKAENKACHDALIPMALLLVKMKQTDRAKSLLFKVQNYRSLAFVRDKEMLRRMFLCLPLIDVKQENDKTKEQRTIDTRKSPSVCQQNINQTVAFLNTIASKNNIAAQLLLSQLYRHGWGVTANNQMAQNYQNKACHHLKQAKEEETYERFCESEETISTTTSTNSENVNENDGKERFSFKITD